MIKEENRCARRARTASIVRAKTGIPPDKSDDFTLGCQKSNRQLHKPCGHDSPDTAVRVSPITSSFWFWLSAYVSALRDCLIGSNAREFR
jgi:hypothetical protein